MTGSYSKVLFELKIVWHNVLALQIFWRKEGGGGGGGGKGVGGAGVGYKAKMLCRNQQTSIMKDWVSTTK